MQNPDCQNVGTIIDLTLTMTRTVAKKSGTEEAAIQSLHPNQFSIE